MKKLIAPSYLTAFILTVLIYSGCKQIEPIVPALKPVVTLQLADSVTATSAVMVATVVPNGDASVSFQYRQWSDKNWINCVASGKYSGTKAVRVSFSLSNLLSGTNYIYKVIAVNTTGSVESDYVSAFNTVTLPPLPPLTPAVIQTSAVENITLSAAKLTASVTPNQDSTTITFQYQAVNAAWQSLTLSGNFSGTAALNVSADLSGLQPNTDYNFRVKVNNKAGEITSASSTFTTYAVSDYDGNLYHAVTIGTQTWLKENFRGTHYANGDPIPNVTDATTWSNLTTGAYCWYNNDPEIGKVYGGLYNWYVGHDSRGLIVGYHVPVSDEWPVLRIYLGDYLVAGPKVMEAGHTHWGTTRQVATNSSGFTALPNGCFIQLSGNGSFSFYELGSCATYWHSDSFGSGSTATSIDASDCGLSDNGVYNKKFGCGLRLLKN